MKKLTVEGKRVKGASISQFSQESVSALNYMIDTLNENFDTEIVITSARRKLESDMDKLLHLLKTSGVNYNKPYKKTIISKNNIRGLEILDYLNKQNEKNNYVVIDDDSLDILDYIPKNHFIKTDIFYGSLNKLMVNNFLKNIKTINENNQVKELKK